MKELRKIHKVSENLTLFGNVANAIDDNFEHLKDKLEVTEAKIPKDVNIISGIEDYATKAYVQNAVASIYTSGTISLDAYATKKYVDNQTLALGTLIQNNTNLINILLSADKKFTTELSDDTHVVFPVGNIGTEVTVGDLKEMTLSQIIQQMLFKEVWPDSKSDYDFFMSIKYPGEYVRYDSPKWTFEGVTVGETEKKQTASVIAGKVSYKTNGNVILQQVNEIDNSNTSNWDEYQYEMRWVYNAKTVYSTSNFGNTIEYTWTDDSGSTVKSVPRVYPTVLPTGEVLINSNMVLERTLSGTQSSKLFIAVPYKGLAVPEVSIKLNTLGWLEANMENWTITETDNYNNTGHKYRIWAYEGTIENTPFRFDIKWQ